MKNKTTTPSKHDVLIIGAGIAGCTIAGEIARTGYDVAIVDQNSGPALETSAHENALAHPQVGKKITKLQRFTQLANQLAIHQWKNAQIHRQAFEPCSELDHQQIIELKELCCEMGYDHKTIQVITRQQAYERTNIDVPGIWYETAAIYSLPKICQQEITELSLNQKYWFQEVQRIAFQENEWHAFAQDGELICSAKSVVLANGMGAQKLLKQLEIELPLRPVRGQLSQFLIHVNSPLIKFLPKKVLRGDGYCLPAKQINPDYWSWEVGSSYDEDHTETLAWVESDKENALKGLTLIGCDHSLIGEMSAENSFVGIRSASKDRLPLIGPLGESTGLFIASAYGSRGVMWSAIAAPMIKAYVEAFLTGAERLRAGFLTGASVALCAEVTSSVAPARFLAGALGARTSNSKPTLPDS
jgi:tRNA 5-methylaminomethyl-2-thiouridine biosynthesis bifunctional protein